jgi:hypothetical protein
MGGGSPRSGAGSPTSRWNPSNCIGANPTRALAQHLSDTDVKALTRALEKISTHARPLRPGRIGSEKQDVNAAQIRATSSS